MIALSVKPNAAYILAPLWFILGLSLFRGQEYNQEELKHQRINFLFSSILMVPGVLWLVRNITLNGMVFSETVMVAANWSIAANLTNPFLYNYIPKNLIAMMGLLLVMVFISLKPAPEFRWPAGILLLLVVGFIFTPVSGFFLRTDVPASINWRFGQAMLAYVFVCVLLLIEFFIAKIAKRVWKLYIFRFALIPICIFITIWLVWSQQDLMTKKPENAFILRDQFRQPVGVGGYYSAYEYVQQNVRNSTVWVENGLPYYAYGPEYTNTVSRAGSADYIILIKTDWFGGGEKYLPSYFSPKSWQNFYTIAYEDSQGIVFELKK